MKQCKIVVTDEVNLKINGLELAERKALMKLFEFDVPGAKYLPSVRLGRWNGKTSYFSLGGSTYINLLPEILPILDRAGYDIELEDTRDYRTNFSFSEVTEETFKHKNWPVGHVMAGQPIVLRDYQIEIINNYLKNPQALQEIATGAGKCLAGNTILALDIDENTPFGKFLINKLQQKHENDVTAIELAIGKLAEYIEEFNETSLVDNVEVITSNFGLSVPTPLGTATINNFIKKFNLPMVTIEFDNGYSVRVAQKHILQQNSNDIFAKELLVGDTVDHHYDGAVIITKITHTQNEDCYDISIDAPYLYYDANGLVHHNTLITAALSNCVEEYGRSIVIVPNTSLVTQTEKDYINLGLDVGVYYGGRKEYDKKHTICTWQSLGNMMKKTKADDAEVPFQDVIDGVICVIVDECFHGDSLVLTPDGYVPIRDIKPGDKVINYSEITGEFKIDTVIKQHKNLTKSDSEKMYELEFDDGNKIQVTGNHKFLTNLGWVRADELTENHEIVNKT